MNEIALARGIKIDVTHAVRAEKQKLSGTVVTPATKSLHLIGRGLDVNLIDKDGRRHRSDDLQEGKMSENVKGFLSDVKSTAFSTEIDRNRSPRWGGDFRDKDPVHIDAPTSEQNWERLFKENQEQLKSGNIEALTIRNPTEE